MEVFKILNKPTIEAPVIFTVEQAIEIFNYHKAGSGAPKISALTSFEITRVKAMLDRFGEIRDMIERIMQGVAVQTQGYTIPAVLDNETGEVIEEAQTIPAVLVEVPETLDLLIGTSLYLINRDHPVDSDPIFSANSIEDIVEAVSYVIVEIIKESKFEKDGTFEWFRDQLIGG